MNSAFVPVGDPNPAGIPNFPAVLDNLDQLVAVLPPVIQEAVQSHPRRQEIIEVVMDLGREPEIRLPGAVEYLPNPVSRADLEYVIGLVGEFSSDNRAGIASTLHRISAIRNRQGKVIGLTCRVGRCVFGSIAMIQDLVEQGKSLLLLGRPGVGKTTALREVARVLADQFHKRVIIIDTSNEIAGDGDIPHPGIGRARRMQVAKPEDQHRIMIEAVENHMPEVVVIDEIGTELEALAARTIAERGVQLVATAHGNQMENLIKNPTLCDLIGGIQSVTLGDEEARRRGSQKTVLERKAPPTFDIAVEMTTRTRWVIYEDVASTVDDLLRNRDPQVQIRSLQGDGTVSIERPVPTWHSSSGLLPPPKRSGAAQGWRRTGRVEPVPAPSLPHSNGTVAPTPAVVPPAADVAPAEEPPLIVYPYALSVFHLEQLIRTLNLKVDLTKDLDQADVILALRSQVRHRSKIQQLAHNRQIPIHTVKSNTLDCLARGLRRLLNLEETDPNDIEAFFASENSDEAEALEETRLAVEQIVIPKCQPVELLPRSAAIRKLQHELVEHYHLKARSFGEEPNRRLRIYPA
ncbi:MAG: R3H domain-containing nucleic acid-binding protein [Thermostichales cyanobacterium SRBZ-1_bins_19]